MLAQPAAAFAAAQLALTSQRLRQRGKKLDRHGGKPRPRELHRVRIAAKRARYAVAFFQSLLRSRASAYLAALTALQDELGALNDVHVADGLLRQLQREDACCDGSADFARGCLASTLGGRGKQAKKLRQLWRAVDRQQQAALR